MRYWIVFFAVLLFTAVAGYSTYERKATVNNQFCTLYTTLVLQVDKGIESVTLAEAMRAKVSYNRGYAFDIQLEQTLENNSPCQIKHTTPPNLLQVIAQQPSAPTEPLPGQTTTTSTTTSSKTSG